MIHVKTYYDLVNQIRAERKCGGEGGGGREEGVGEN